ncbi:putative FBD-associated F-box protein At3g50710 [Cornus florida]|uniref:putative FBD-associated F-box protein At3g50710 n=1 Tax=Cornus florida TaxID=4283 RepID=UPI00289FE85F|nr:putative FBD-associated F-box protein At3g50710 [Cornus florida]
MFALNVPRMVCLPSLKILHLDKIVFTDGGSTKRLVSGCPVLEDLVLIACYWEDHNFNVFNISALSLKSLTIHSDIRNYKFVFNTPNLQYLQYFDYVAAEGYSMDNFNSLVDADIKLMSNIEYGIGGSIIGDKSVEEVNVVKFLGGISKVQRLYFHSDSIEALHGCSLPNFYHLTYLELGVLDEGDTDGWELLPELLERAPKLETLVCKELLYHGHDCYTKHQFRWHTPSIVPSCLLFHLKVIEIRYFYGTSDELKMAGYFLKNAKVLKRFVIRSARDQQSKICNTLLGLHK